MKKILTIIIVFFVVGFSVINAQAVETPTESFEIVSNTDKENLYNSLSDDAKKSLSNLGISSIDPNQINNLSFDKVMNELLSAFTKESATPMKALISVISVMLLSSVLSGLKNTLSNNKMQQTIDIVSTLCITTALVMPVSNTILQATNVIVTASNFMLTYIPIMLVVMVSSGQAVSGGAYYSMMIMAGQGVSQIASKIITPLLNAFLGISIASSISNSINLSGITAFISKIIKWLLGFTMTIFTALLTFRQIITTSMDNVSTRAVRFTLNSLIPVVGSALSDAYRTIQSSVNLIKSGMGVFVIISIAVVFLPIIAQCIMWQFTIGISKMTGEVLNLQQPCKVLEAVSTVVTTLMAIIFCIMAVDIISTAVILLMGGAKG